MTTETLDERLNALVVRVHVAMGGKQPLPRELGKKLLLALIRQRHRYAAVAQQSRGRLKDIRAKAAFIKRHATLQEVRVRAIDDWNSHLLDRLTAQVRRNTVLETVAEVAEAARRAYEHANWCTDRAGQIVLGVPQRYAEEWKRALDAAKEGG